MSNGLFPSTFIRSRSSNDSRLVTHVGYMSGDSFLIEQVRIEHHPDMLIAGFAANLSHTGNLFQRLLDPLARQNRPSQRLHRRFVECSTNKEPFSNKRHASSQKLPFGWLSYRFGFQRST